MIRLVILTILFISSFSFGAVNKNLDKVMESQKNISIKNTITSENVNKNQTMGNTNKPIENTQSSSNKTNQTQSNKNTTTQTNENKVTQTNTIPTPVPTTKPTVQCEGNKHGIETGNSNRWFLTEKEAISFFDAEQEKWSNMLINNEIDIDTYNKKCPYGYEDWSCPLCQKWTINLYYR